VRQVCSRQVRQVVGINTSFQRSSPIIVISPLSPHHHRHPPSPLWFRGHQSDKESKNPATQVIRAYITCAIVQVQGGQAAGVVVVGVVVVQWWWWWCGGGGWWRQEVRTQRNITLHVHLGGGTPSSGPHQQEEFLPITNTFTPTSRCEVVRQRAFHFSTRRGVRRKAAVGAT